MRCASVTSAAGLWSGVINMCPVWFGLVVLGGKTLTQSDRVGQPGRQLRILGVVDQRRVSA